MVDLTSENIDSKSLPKFTGAIITFMGAVITLQSTVVS